MVAGGIAKRQDFLAAGLANESVVIFGKAFTFHSSSLSYAELAENARHDLFTHRTSVKLRECAKRNFKV